MPHNVIDMDVVTNTPYLLIGAPSLYAPDRRLVLFDHVFDFT
jgi:hypothetical protein